MAHAEPVVRSSRRHLVRSSHSSRACSPYTSPALSSVQGVYEPLTITWDSSCVSLGSSVDLYLSVLESSGTEAVHEWTDVSWSAGKLQTELKPSWWNASTGAGSVQAQFIFVPSGNEIWDTSAPTGPVFSIAYNGSYPSETSSALLGNYTGPSVESVASSGKSFDSAKLGPAIAVPLLALAGLIGAYVLYNKRKKKPETKRWSAVVDHRVSMISNGTIAPPRHSMMSQRPGSMASRPGSVFDGGASFRRSHFSEGPRPGSYHSIGTGVNAMGAIGQGDRGSRISFAEGARQSFSSSRKAPSIYSRHSVHPGPGGPPSPNLPAPPPLPQISPRKAERMSVQRMSQVGYFAPHSRYSTHGSVRSGHSGQGSMYSPPIGRSGTTEELSSSAMSGPLPRPRTRTAPGGHKHTKSSLGQEYRTSLAVADFPALEYANLMEGKGGPTTPDTIDEEERPSSPFADPLPLPPVAVMAPEREDEQGGMRLAYATMSPDEAMASYAAAQQSKTGSPAIPTSPTLTPAPLMARAASSASMIKSKSAGLLAGFGNGTGKMMRSLSSKASLRISTAPATTSDAPASPPLVSPPTSPLFATVISPPAPIASAMTSSASTPIADMLARGQLARSASSPLVRPPLSPTIAYGVNPFKTPEASPDPSSSSSKKGSFGEAL